SENLYGRQGKPSATVAPAATEPGSRAAVSPGPYPRHDGPGEAGVRGDLVTRFAEVLTAVGGTPHGPLEVDDALDLRVALSRQRAGSAAVAVSTGDPVIVNLGVLGRLTAAGLEVLTPDDVFWRERLAEAGAGVTGAVAGIADSGTVGVACGTGAPR